MCGLGDLPRGGSADFHYYLWVDQFNTLGMGKDVVILNGTGSDSLLALDPAAEGFAVIRIPYPLNTFSVASTGASMTRTPAGRGGGFGSTTVSTR